MENKRTKGFAEVVLASLFAVFLLVVPFLTIFIVGTATALQFELTYYGELSKMYAKLQKTENKKIVVIGNSNISFGVDSGAFRAVLKEAGLDFAVCNMGLYGALGTKMMMENRRCLHRRRRYRHFYSGDRFSVALAVFFRRRGMAGARFRFQYVQ